MDLNYEKTMTKMPSSDFNFSDICSVDWIDWNIEQID